MTSATLLDADPIERLASKLEAQSPDEPAERLAVEHARTLHADRAFALLVAGLTEFIRQARRRRVEMEERQAYRASPAGRLETEDRRDAARWRRSERAERERLMRDDPAEFRRRYSIDGAVEAFREAVRGEVVGELMAKTFTLPDGRLVGWADASVADHEAAITPLLAMASESLTDIARHEEAIELIVSGHGRSLADVVQVAA